MFDFLHCFNKISWVERKKGDNEHLITSVEFKLYQWVVMQEVLWDSNFSLWFCNMSSKAFAIFSFQLAFDQNKTTLTDKKKWICMNFIAGKDVHERATSGQEVHVGCGGQLSHEPVHSTWLVNLISTRSAAAWHNPRNMDH